MNEKPWLASYEKHVPREFTYPDFTIQQLLTRTADAHPDYIATTLNDIDITYGELNEKVNRFARVLIKKGVKKGDRVALFLVNTPTYVIAYFATLKLGGIIVNIGVGTMGDELVNCLIDSGSKIIITLDIFAQNLYNIVKKTGLTDVILHSVLGMEKKIKLEQGMPGPEIFNDLVNNEPADEPEAETSGNDLAVVQYTSGSTGTPKGVALTHANIVANLYQSEVWIQSKEDENAAVICMIPFFHVFGMLACMLVSVMKGYRMILMPRFDWSDIIQLMKTIETYKPVSFPAVPSLWAALLSFPDVTKKHLGMIKVPSCGGAPLPDWVNEKFEEITGRKIMNAYGLSEAASATHLAPYPGGGPKGSIGLPLPGTDAKIVDIEDGNIECDRGEIGELILKGPQIMLEYWNRPELTARAIRNGWLYSSDLAYMDKEGFFYLVDRKDDLIITSGFNVYPSQVEAVLTKHPKVSDVAAVGIPDRIKGEAIAVLIVLEEGEKADREEFVNYCRENLADYRVPKKIIFRDEIPKNPAGKPLRRIMRKEIE